MFGCKEGNFPFRYLGIAMHFRKLSNKVSSLIEEHFEKQKFGSWKGKLLSSGGRLVLINSVLSSLSMFMMFFFLFLKEYLKGWITTDPGFFSQCDDHRKKYTLAKWNVLCKPRCTGCLGNLNLDVRKSCFLIKWLFKLLNEEGLWQDVLKKKHFKKTNACPRVVKLHFRPRFV